MKVILLKDVKSLGKMGDVVNVSDGYGRNFILPTGAGVLADKKNMNALKLRLQKEEKLAAERLQEAEGLKAQIEKTNLVLKIKAGKDGKAFGSVSTKEIAEALKAQAGIEVDKKKIETEDAIKALGKYTLNVRLHKDVSAKLQLDVQEA